MAEESMLDILKRAVGYLSLHGYEAEAKALSADARALLAAGASEGQMPVAIYHGNGTIDCGDSGHHNIELLKMIPAGAKLYKDPSGEIAVLREALKGAEITANAAGAEIAALRERIAGMEKDAGWISVEDRLPKNDQIVAFVVQADRESPIGTSMATFSVERITRVGGFRRQESVTARRTGCHCPRHPRRAWRAKREASDGGLRRRHESRVRPHGDVPHVGGFQRRASGNGRQNRRRAQVDSESGHVSRALRHCAVEACARSCRGRNRDRSPRRCSNPQTQTLGDCRVCARHGRLIRNARVPLNQAASSSAPFQPACERRHASTRRRAVCCSYRSGRID